MFRTRVLTWHSQGLVDTRKLFLVNMLLICCGCSSRGDVAPSAPRGPVNTVIRRPASISPPSPRRVECLCQAVPPSAVAGNVTVAEALQLSAVNVWKAPEAP